MKKIILAILLFVELGAFAQVPEDALRYSFFPQNGTARSLAIGGAMGSLGGDVSTLFVNPAGLGNYRTGEFVYSPGFFLNNTKTDFRNSSDKSNKNNFDFGTLGLVYGMSNQYKPTISRAFGFGISKIADFNNTVSYKGLNNYSSGSEQFAEEFANSGYTIDEVLNTQSPIPYTAAPALYTYLVDTFRINDTTVSAKGLPEFLILPDGSNALLQENKVSTKGGLYEIALGYAVNKNDKLLIGGSIGIPIMDYRSTTEFKESDTSSNTNNNFGYFKYTDNFSTQGAGINLKFGLIYRPKEYIRLGLAVHTPTYMFSLTDKHSTFLEAETENYAGYNSVSSNDFTNGRPGESNYTMLTPWKAIISGSYVFREIQDVTKQKAFITADIEYINHRSSNFFSAQEQPTDDDIAYFKGLRQVIKQEYKGNFNFRVGGELKFNTIMVRLGFAYYSNPYKDAELKAHKMLVSGGLGYRNKGFFIDLTYVHSFNKDVNFPYRLGDKSNTYATVNNQRGNIVASVGVKF